MKTRPPLLPPALCAVFALAGAAFPQDSPAPPAAAPPDMAGLLREALFEEQGVRDPEKAAAAYQKIIAVWETGRSYAATAVYRLAEVRRGQNRKDEAAALYRRLLTEFPDHDPLARLSRENLAALGVRDLPGPAAAPSGEGAAPAAADAQDVRIAELRQQLRDSPDMVLGTAPDQPLTAAVEAGQIRVVNFLLEAGARTDASMLEMAARNGHLSVCQALIAHGADAETLSGALRSAVNSGRLEVTRLLLEKGADVNRNPVLLSAVQNGRADMARLLLEKGADPNAVEPRTGNNALFSAAESGNREMLDLLITAKASPSLPPPARSPFYPTVRKGDLELARRLLGLGADVRARCLDFKASGPERGLVGPPKPEIQGNFSATTEPGRSWTPLHAAVLSKKPEMVALILASGGAADLETPGGPLKLTPLTLAMPNAPVPMIEALLKAGARPDIRDPDGWPLLLSAGRRPEAEMLVKLLLDAGADPNATIEAGAGIAAGWDDLGEKVIPLLRLLTAAGGRIEPGLETLLSSLKGAVAVKLSREFRYPLLAASRQVTLSLPEDGFTLPLEQEADGPAGRAPRSLTDLLLEARGVRWFSGLPPEWGTPRLFRRDAGGALKEREEPGNWMSGPGPALQWGDIVEFVSAGWQNTDTGAFRDYTYSSGLPRVTENLLRNSLVRHVTVTLDGKSWPITLRGALKVYNPLKPEAPLTDAVTLMGMMGAADPQWDRASVRVRRQPAQGGGEISARLDKGPDIPLKEGDALDLIGEPVSWVRSGNGVSQAPNAPGGGFGRGFYDNVLLSPGLPFSSTVSGSSSGAPTLVQFLAEAYAPVSLPAVETMKQREGAAAFGAITGKNAAEALALAGEPVRSVLPHPDWERLVIRRVGEDGKTTDIPVNLAAVIQSCTEATTIEEAAARDVPLMAADRVLVPVLAGAADRTWTGFDEATLRFFSKVLAAEVTLVYPDGNFSALRPEYMPLRYLETEAGLLGIPAKPVAFISLSTFTAESLVSHAAPGRIFSWLQRAGDSSRIQAQPTGQLPTGRRRQILWLRAGDTIGLAAQNPAPPAVSVPPPPPAPAAVSILPPPPAPVTAPSPEAR